MSKKRVTAILVLGILLAAVLGMEGCQKSAAPAATAASGPHASPMLAHIKQLQDSRQTAGKPPNP